MNMIKHEKVLNWKFVIVFLVLILLSYFVFSAIETNLQFANKDKQISALHESVDNLIALNKKQSKDARDDRIASRIERRQLLSYNEAQADRLRQILVYLSNHNFELPQSLLTPIKPPIFKPVVKTKKPQPKHHSTGSTGGGGSTKHGHSKSHMAHRLKCLRKHHKHC